MKIGLQVVRQPHEKRVNSVFTGKFVIIFFFKDSNFNFQFYLKKK